MGSRTVTITLQVEVDGDEVRGAAWAATPVAGATPGGVAPVTGATPGRVAPVAGATPPAPFAGWLGLIGAIDALLGFPADAGAGARALVTGDGT